LRGLPAIERLDLSFNLLGRVRLDSSATLEELSLRCNVLSSVSLVASEFLALRDLRLDWNRLDNAGLPKGLYNMPSLHGLYLQGNCLSTTSDLNAMFSFLLKRRPSVRLEVLPQYSSDTAFISELPRCLAILLDSDASSAYRCTGCVFESDLDFALVNSSASQPVSKRAPNTIPVLSRGLADMLAKLGKNMQLLDELSETTCAELFRAARFVTSASAVATTLNKHFTPSEVCPEIPKEAVRTLERRIREAIVGQTFAVGAWFFFLKCRCLYQFI
jgi:hypothetical protein